MTRFDAGPSTLGADDSSTISARAVVAMHPGTVVLSILLAALMIAIAASLLFVGQGAQYRLASAIDALQLSVFLQPQASRADAEGMRARIEAVPFVVGARLRTREDAMTSLVGAGLPALATKANPLPDVWIVSLGRPNGSNDAPALSARVADTRVALEALPNVEAVRVDARWVDLLDRSSLWVGRGMTVAVWTISTTLLAALLGLSLLTGRAMKSNNREQSGGVQALATVGMMTGLASLLLTGGLLALVTVSLPGSDAVWKPILDSIGRMGHVFVVAMGLAVIVVCAIGHALGGSHR